MNTPANMSVAAHIRAEREKARQEVMASCAAWRQAKTPPQLRESPPRASKTTALACIASQLHRRPPEKRPGYIPVASVVKESVDRCGSVSAASPVVGRYRPLQPIDSMILRVAAAAAAAAAVALLWSC